MSLTQRREKQFSFFIEKRYYKLIFGKNLNRIGKQFGLSFFKVVRDNDQDIENNFRLEVGKLSQFSSSSSNYAS